jgi:glycosyltransferase involved in cell wall biosynthesis
MPRLSAIIITYNEAKNLPDCLESVAFCDEVIVVDRGSEDETQAIARAAGAKVIEQAWLGYGPQKNVALSHATGEWALSLDADERIPAGLAAEIGTAMTRGDANGYDMPRSSSFLGRPMRHSGWWPDRVLRLFRREQGRFTDDVVHERVVVDGKIAHLKEAIEHQPVRRIEQAVSRVDRYSSLGAEKLIKKGRRVGFFTALGRGWFAFVRTYVLQLGFLDGREGFILAVCNAEGTYYRYLKAWLATREAR